MGVFDRIKKFFTKEAGDAQRLTLVAQSAHFHLMAAGAELGDDGNLEHGWCHAVNLISFDPGEPEWRAVVDAYIQRLGPQQAERLLTEGHFSNEAVRTLLWAQQGKVSDAIGLLMQVAEAKPSARFAEAWLPDYVDKLNEPVELPVLYTTLGIAMKMLSEQRYLSSEEAARQQILARCVVRMADAHDLEPMAEMLVLGVMRKGGLFDEGKQRASDMQTRAPSWEADVAVGLMLREAGELDAALPALRAALQKKPQDPSPLLEGGDGLFNAKRYDEAASWYGEALDVDAGNAWAKTSVQLCTLGKARADGRDDVVDAMRQQLLPQAQHGDGRAALAFDDVQSFTGRMPEPGDATINVFQQVREQILSDADTGGEVGGDDAQDKGGNSLSLKLSNVEAPSCLLTVRLGFAALKKNVALNVEVENFATPDPRLPVEEVAFSLWDLDGDDLVPGRPSPSPEVAHAVAELVVQDTTLDEMWVAASYVGAELGVDAVDDLLACVVHPDAVSIPDDVDVLDWVPRWQTAACFALAHVDDGWANSKRKEALFAVLLGPRDWSTGSAITTLWRLARGHERISDDVDQAFMRLDDARPNAGHLAYAEALLWHWRLLPSLSSERREQLQGQLQAFYEAE